MNMRLPIALTMGEPAGIAPEITAQAWSVRDREELSPFFVIGDPSLYKDDVPVQEIEDPLEVVNVFEKALPFLPLKLNKKAVAGRLDEANAPCVIESIRCAVDFVLQGRAAALVTNPIHKSILKTAGFDFPGHTEFLAHLCGGNYKSVMMLSAKGLNVVPLTIHEALADVPFLMSQDRIVETSKIILTALQKDFGFEKPRLAIAGLNPHAGENGQFGKEEIEIISPAIETLKNEGHDVSGPYSADTMFHNEARAHYDAALCMYHDQALIPVKTLDFHGGVNITLGLPIVRTSPDHGTALDIAGQGKARSDSLIAAILKADEIVGLRRR